MHRKLHFHIIIGIQEAISNFQNKIVFEEGSKSLHTFLEWTSLSLTVTSKKPVEPGVPSPVCSESGC